MWLRRMTSRSLGRTRDWEGKVLVELRAALNPFPRLASPCLPFRENAASAGAHEAPKWYGAASSRDTVRHSALMEARRMAGRIFAVTLTERDAQRVEGAVLDRDASAALDLLDRVVKPQIDAARKGGCKPFFESPMGTPDTAWAEGKPGSGGQGGL